MFKIISPRAKGLKNIYYLHKTLSTDKQLLLKVPYRCRLLVLFNACANPVVHNFMEKNKLSKIWPSGFNFNRYRKSCMTNFSQ